MGLSGSPAIRPGGDYLRGHEYQRAQFVTNLVRSEANAKTAQLLARHSTAALTLDRYARLQAVDLVSAIEQLPNLPSATPERPAESLKATGTTDHVAVPVAGNVAGGVVSPCLAVVTSDAVEAATAASAQKENPFVTRGCDSSSPAVSGDDSERRWSELNRRWRICNPLP